MGSRRSSAVGSARGYLASKGSYAPSLADSIESVEIANLAKHESPVDLEKEMKEVMKDIGEKLPLKFKHLRDAFRPLDLSHNGKITLTEMRSFLRGFGWPHEVADRLFRALDDDRGEIDFNLFMSHFDA